MLKTEPTGADLPDASRHIHAATPTAALQHLGLALCGDTRVVTSLTGTLPLLR